ncbi:hypothetical protein FS842_002418 [Serendipita sp. 407]|nr:hypothetical protein FS842_002418 [Serendipita sp. 407]
MFSLLLSVLATALVATSPVKAAPFEKRGLAQVISQCQHDFAYTWCAFLSSFQGRNAYSLARLSNRDDVRRVSTFSSRCLLLTTPLRKCRQTTTMNSSNRDHTLLTPIFELPSTT